MKTAPNLSKESLKKALDWFLGTWPVILISIAVVAFIILAFIALYPKLDPSYIAVGEAKVKELDIRFDTKLIGELSATKQPSELKASGGRDPFAGY